MKSATHGTGTSPEVTNISAHGFWIFWNGTELFLDYVNFPWFKNATIAEVSEIETPAASHLHWPALDVDLTKEQILHPDKYPLKSQS